MRYTWLCGIAALWAGCHSDLGDGPSGHSIKGKVRYEGSRLEGFAEPALIILADTQLGQVEGPPPHALATFTDFDAKKPVAYELRYLLPGRYFVTAVLADLEDFDVTTTPVGGYPDACVLIEMPEQRPVEVDDEDLEGIDITIYDAVGDDPCFDAGGDAGMPSGASGTVRVELLADEELMPAADDRMRVGLHLNGPILSREPTFAQDFEGPEFPLDLDFADVPVGEWGVTVCLQRADSTSMQCMGSGDVLAFYPSLTETLTVEEGETVRAPITLRAR